MNEFEFFIIFFNSPSIFPSLYTLSPLPSTAAKRTQFSFGCGACIWARVSNPLFARLLQSNLFIIKIFHQLVWCCLSRVLNWMMVEIGRGGVRCGGMIQFGNIIFLDLYLGRQQRCKKFDFRICTDVKCVVCMYVNFPLRYLMEALRIQKEKWGKTLFIFAWEWRKENRKIQHLPWILSEYVPFSVCLAYQNAAEKIGKQEWCFLSTDGKKKWIAKFPFSPPKWLHIINNFAPKQPGREEFKVNREYRWRKLENLITRLINFGFIMSRIKHRGNYFFISKPNEAPLQSPSQQPPQINVNTV